MNLRARPNERAAVVARLEPRVPVRLGRCDRTWCAVGVPEHDLSGYVRQVKLWGAIRTKPLGPLVRESEERQTTTADKTHVRTSLEKWRDFF
ncbi:hypothetical protein DC522_11895 [Microvirga sp. KLBC 81]|uniref:SH3 domain-containing protein n=1 Tax=Microvirga sp. KLBC 81 TaxID=1862707 RepID=UPI000D5201AE|nr:hypothetical protein DC522_11895 [Microvirga sp. KLBC 81]